ncbi:MAG: acyltransferase [Bacteroidales bacterium]|nr:acyltransferase [Bacteroidales bacterium]
MYKEITHFKGLNTLRFIAASLVVLHHSATIGRKYELFNIENFSLFRNGANAVSFFFVLSGFLITYLLLKEKNQTKTISIKSFYLRRVKRIWPLYFLLIFIGTIFLPFFFSIFNIDYQMPYTLSQTWYYFLFFFPILVLFNYGNHFLEPLWSIGVEEVFYLIWAPLFKFIKKSLIPILFIIAIKLSLSIYIQIQGIDISTNLFAFLIHNYSFETMAIGALGAYLLFTTPPYKSLETSILFAKPIKYLLYLIVIIYLCFNINIDNCIWNFVFKTPVLSPLIISLLYLYIIISYTLSFKEKKENKTLFLLGEISYGIYMYHMGVMFLVVLIFSKLKAFIPNSLLIITFLIVVFLLTIVISSLSKRYFENFFLRKKEKNQRKI